MKIYYKDSGKDVIIMNDDQDYEYAIIDAKENSCNEIN